MLIVAPIVLLVIASNVADALAPSLTPDPDEPGSGNPLLLIALNARNRYLVAVSNYLDAWAYYLVGTLRLLAADPPFYFLGYFYGDAAVSWIEGKSPTMGRYARAVESLFGKASYPLVFLAPNNLFCLFAGAAGMRPAWFVALNLSGTLARLYVLRVVGEVFQDPIDDVLGWIGDNRLWLTGVSVSLVLLSVLMDRRGKGELEGITDLVEEEPEGQGRDDERGAVRPAVAAGALVVALSAVGAGAWILVGDDADPPPAPAGNAGVVLREPVRPSVQMLGPAGCEAWSDGADEVRCEIVDDEWVWLVARTGERRQAKIFRRVDDERFAVTLVAEDRGGEGSPPVWQEIGASAADLDGDGDQEVAFGFHLAGSGGIVVTELLDDGVVVAHGELDHGVVRLGRRGLETWSARFAPDDPSCCPSSFEHVVVARSGNEWVEVESEVVAPEAVPESEV